MILAFFLSIPVLSAWAVITPCPENFIPNLSNPAAVSAVLKTSASAVNCTDDTGATPLTTALNAQVDCPLLDSAKLLVEKGANVNQIEGRNLQTPLFYAVQAYGLIYGKSSPVPLRETCFNPAREPEFRGLVKQLLDRGADPTYQAGLGGTIQSVAKENQVEFLLQK
jgi:hypothetical protein